MATSSSAKLRRPTIGVTLLLLIVAAVLWIEWAALGQEILTIPENQKIAAEINARLPLLRTDRDSLLTQIADLKNEVEKHRTEAEQARTLALELPGLQAEESRTRSERERLSKESLALADEIAVQQGTVNGLIDQERNLRNEIEILTNRTQEERKRLEVVQNDVNTKQGVLAKISDNISAKGNELDQVNLEVSRSEQSLATKLKILNELVADEQSINHRIGNLQTKADELTANISIAESRFDEIQMKLGNARADLEILRKERDSTKFELDKVNASLETTSANKEAAKARLLNLTNQEANIRHQLRSLFDQIQDAVLFGQATGTTE